MKDFSRIPYRAKSFSLILLCVIVSGAIPFIFCFSFGFKLPPSWEPFSDCVLPLEKKINQAGILIGYVGALAALFTTRFDKYVDRAKKQLPKDIAAAQSTVNSLKAASKGSAVKPPNLVAANARLKKLNLLFARAKAYPLLKSQAQWIGFLLGALALLCSFVEAGSP